MGVSFQELDYIMVVEAAGDNEQVPQRVTYSAKSSENSEYVVRRGVDYVLIFPLSSFLVVSFKCVLDNTVQTPRPNVTMVKMPRKSRSELTMGDRIYYGTTSGGDQLLTTYEDYAVFAGDEFNEVSLTFDYEPDDGPDDYHQILGYHYEICVEADVGLDTHVSKLLQFFVRYD
jgi:hypothetical protein